MSHKRATKRKAFIAAGGVAALGAAALILPNAMASQTDAKGAAPKTLAASDASDLASQLQDLLGDAFAGAYYDKGEQRLIINVIDGLQIEGDDNNVIIQAQEAGAEVREVENSWSELQKGAATLKEQATVPGTAWAIDPRTNKLQVTADSTVSGENWDTIESAVKSLGSDMATIKKSAGTFKTFLEGGDAIFGGGARCSAGFNVVNAEGAPAFLTAGHCGVAEAEWSEEEGGAPIATVDAATATFPGAGDFALVDYNDPATQAASTVDLGNGQTVDINAAGEAAVGLQVFRMGSTTGLADGQVTGLEATVNYPEGTVTGLIQTDVCAEPGDSGGSLFTEDGQAIGLTSGGSGDCTVGGETFFQPVTTALAATGATLGDAGAGAGEEAAGGAGEEADGGAAAGAGEEADGGAVAGAGEEGAAAAGAGEEEGAAAAGAGEEEGAAAAGAGEEGDAGDAGAVAGAGDAGQEQEQGVGDQGVDEQGVHQ
ncbi:MULTISPECIES: S1 family peptidase [Streptomyces]|uniref:S1 family peptidase n=1 Tax=Streptomyces caniscabiei TaxID=2746961 RepID=A0ABU4MVH3_9ACTN|nr:MULTISPECIES: S1 family peptidase [Streptomyces]MDX2940890.1 S1 family peptidase [Streptomyces caniscabiei]MDX2952640.1 S1 family peptidase [Streptomyces caniscabiei]MDX2982475.1 S1 family peptidase [Streptomyces caniscabiei]MDX3008887.1 S1 family peptidase [Streptomyces caniscabiei]MDX3041439.1 S1 family peptidase [Streptomyces caniscabiei]